MPRKVIPLITGETYHIFNRGVDKRNIFLNKGDYLRFYQSLNLFNVTDPVVNFRLAKNLKQTAHQELVSIHAYALLPNHFHLILSQKVDGGISEFMKRISAGYTGYFNERNQRSGSLFQGSFKRVHVENDPQYKYLLAYVNENHTVHGLSRKSDICYSSSPHYQKISQSIVIDQNLNYDDYDTKSAKKMANNIKEKRAAAKLILE